MIEELKNAHWTEKIIFPPGTPRTKYLIWRVIRDEGPQERSVLASRFGIKETTVRSYLPDLVRLGLLVRNGQTYQMGSQTVATVAKKIKSGEITWEDRHPRNGRANVYELNPHFFLGR